MSGQRLVIDACSAMNLLATGCEVELLRAVDIQLLITPEARAEVSYLLGPPDADGVMTRIPANLDALEQAGLLETRALDDSCLDEFIRCAERLKDVEAGCLALAASFGFPLMTDDGKARKTFTALYPKSTLISTLQLVQRATVALACDDASIRTMLLNLQQRGNFAPPRSEPEGEWYRSYLGKRG